MGEQLPPKINLWGEKITGVPEGKNKYVEYLFDVTKFKRIDTNNFQFKLYQMWKDDAYNSEWLPSMPQRKVKVNGVDVRLKGKDYAELCEIVGKTRKNLAQAYILSASSMNLKDNPESKETMLKMIKEQYEEGATIGKTMFLIKKGWVAKTPQELEKMNE